MHQHGEADRIGDRLPRQDLQRLLCGRGQYVDDLVLPRMLHLAFLRSPFAHAKIVEVNLKDSESAPGIAAMLDGAQLAKLCEPLSGVAANRPGHKAPLQYPLAVDFAHWQGQPVVAAVAETRAQAEDALELIHVEWEELEPILAGNDALRTGAKPIHAELGDNLAYEHRIVTGNPDSIFAEAATVIASDFTFNRQTGLSLETRGIIADFNIGSESLTVYQSHQSPFQMQRVFCNHLGMAESKVRVVAPDVGGAFGIKVNTYAEDLAVVLASRILGRPVKFIADRLESFVSDVHARDHKFTAKIAVSGQGDITAMSVDDVASVGAFGMHARFNIAEGMMLLTNMGSPYRYSNYSGRVRNAYVNKNIVGMYRGVGIPLSCVATEVLVDRAAAAIGMDPIDFRLRNLRSKNDPPSTSGGGLKVSGVTVKECLDRLVADMNYVDLRAEQEAYRRRGTYRGIGISTFVESTSYGPVYYGPTGSPVTSQDGCSLRLDPDGGITCISSVTDQGQGTLAGIAQVVADTISVPVSAIRLVSGDTAVSTYGGGSWASRGMVCGGEAALKAARALLANILQIAASVSQMSMTELTVRNGGIVNTVTNAVVMSLTDVATIGYFRQDTLPRDLNVQLMVTQSHVVNDSYYCLTSGAQASYVEVDHQTGFVKALAHWVVNDCGRVVNPLLVNEQMRGGVVQGIGAVLYEECVYDTAGNMTNCSMAEYLAPMASEMPDIYVTLLEIPENATQLGARGIGEAGLIGSMGAIWVAVNDALRPLNATVAEQPFTPNRILDAIAAAAARN
jgi:carbon-monoxide dehydrogenase large subunit